MKTYKQLTQEQRYQIYMLKKIGHSQIDIASCNCSRIYEKKG